MEVVHLPSHLIENVYSMREFKFKYRHNTLIAYDEDIIKVLSHSMLLLERAEAPSIGFSREMEFTPSKKINDAYIFRSGIYSINHSSKGILTSKKKSTVSIFHMDFIGKEWCVNFDSKIISHADTTNSK